jgi:hypothetical protein
MGVVVLSGCASQIAALAPVGGDEVTAVRFAAIDVLLDKRYGILQAPECTQTGDAVGCAGSLTDGRIISVAADVGTSPHTMTVLVADTLVYQGEVQKVLDRAARNEPVTDPPPTPDGGGSAG